jgi:hypothetical protein
MREIQTKLQRRQAHEDMLAELLRGKKVPDILSAAMAAMRGEPHPKDPWSFKSVLENQGGTVQAERFISIIRKTRRSTIVEDKDSVKAVWDIAGLPWVRSLEDWESRGKRADTRFKSLAAHLICKYRMPEFLFSVFFLPADREGARHDHLPVRNRNQMLVLYEHLAGGGSVKAAVSEGLLPVPLTKKMCHEFMQGPAKGDVYTAIRYAQTRASGGSESLAHALSATQLGRGIYAEDLEPRILTVIEWFSRQGMLNPDVVGPTFDYIENQLRDLDFVITGRSVAAVQRAADEWHEALNRVQNHPRGARNAGWAATYGAGNRVPPEKFEPSGFNSELFEMNNSVWSVEEILTMNALQNEGHAMKHCVSSYWYRVESGQTSIWSLQHEGSRQLTLEVDNSIRSVVQARGVCNQPPNAEQRRLLSHWAAKNNLRISSAVTL